MEIINGGLKAEIVYLKSRVHDLEQENNKLRDIMCEICKEKLMSPAEIKSRREWERIVEDSYKEPEGKPEDAIELLKLVRQYWGVSDYSYYNDPKFYDELENKVDKFLEGK